MFDTYPGYTQVAQVDRSDGDYQFDIVRVWRKNGDRNALYFESDSGCSCPCPFEDNTVEGLERFTKRSWKYFEESVNSGYGGCPAGDIEAFLRNVELELKKK